jgi:hypothetical protein
MTSTAIPVYIVTDCFDSLEKETFEKRMLTIENLYSYKEELLESSDVTFNPENNQQLIAVSQGKLVSLTLLSDQTSWENIDNYIRQ